MRLGRLDKTGTITWGEPTVVQVVALAGWDQREALRLAAAAVLWSVAFPSGFSALTALVSELNYEKIGARGRANATAYALTHHLI